MTMVLCVCSAVMCLVLGFIGSAFAGSVILNSNSIKSIPSVAGAGHPVSVSPDEFNFDAGAQNLAIDSIQVRILRRSTCNDLENTTLSFIHTIVLGKSVISSLHKVIVCYL